LLLTTTATAAPPAALTRRVDDEPWLTRHRPRRNLVELGVGVGALIASANHELYDYKLTWRRYAPAAANLGLRAGFYPLALLGVEAEAALAPTRTDLGAAARLFGVRGQVVLQLPLYSIVPFAAIGGGILGTRGALGSDVDPSLHFGGGLKLFASRWLGARIDARAHVGPAHTAAAYRSFHAELLATFIVTLGRPYLDTDHDGLPDPGQRAPNADACPRETGPRRLRGCPDDDADGLRNHDDRCPTLPGLSARDGCPALVDSDHDGYYDPGQYKVPEGRVDTCPDELGVDAYTGCPVPDTDHDGMDDQHDRCAREPETTNGFQDDDGCPDRIPLDVAAILGTIGGIQFAFLSDQLTETSKPILRQAAAVLAQHPELKLEIQGHTDADGDAAFNKELSLRRALAVRRELVDDGVPAERLHAVGYGGEVPIASNTSEYGRAANRRIEFRLLDSDGNPIAINPAPRP
jgi:OOP family OmpA-OmpF porin